MILKLKSKNILISIASLLSFFTIVWASNAEVTPDLFFSPPSDLYIAREDTSDKEEEEELPFPFRDESWDPFASPGSGSGGLYLNNPSNIKSEFIYDPVTGNYNYNQKLGDRNFRNPVYMTFEEYVDYNMNQSNRNYFRQRIESEEFDQSKPIIPKIHVGGETFDRIFGGNTVDIRPQGTAELIFALQSNRIDNPAIPEKQRRQTNFDFDQKIQLNVVGNIGEKLKLTTSYNTEASFDFENQMKLEYTGYEDEIIKKIEAGNVSLPLTGSLITGSQSLFGVKTQLQFGRLTVTSIFSQQQGKKQEVESAGGAQTSKFDISADNYEANKHFFLAHYFRDRYNTAMASLPLVNSTINITKVEVWITNSNIGATTNIRNVVGLMDLGEPEFYNQGGFIDSVAGAILPDKGSNTLYEKVKNVVQIRSFYDAGYYLQTAANFESAIDYDVAEGARLLSASEYTISPQLGFISLNQTLNPDQVLAVAFQYTIGGSSTVYQVGEFSTDGITGQQALILKLLKSTNLNTSIPMWDLMMKNVYSLGAYNINKEGFKLDILYSSIEQGIDVNYISEGAIRGRPLLQVMNLDRLNTQGDAQPDGVFDFVEGLTINPANGRIYFPVLEPFGQNLRDKIAGNPPDPNLQQIANKYVFSPLYDTTKTAAQQRPDLNRFKIKGTYQSSSSSEISLNAFNIPPGSVTVTAGGTTLTENVHYTVDYNMGRVTIIDQSYLESNMPIKASFESKSMFAQQSRSLFGSHFDYKINKDFNLGATVMNLTERPLTNKVNIGDEPMSNTIWGIEANYRTDAPLLTKLVDKLPFLETKEMSTITFSGEFAHLLPGSSKAIGKEGIAYLDDFEGSQTTIDIRSSNAWILASTPQKQPDMFPEADAANDIRYGFNRAKLAWYTIDPLFFRNNNLTPEYIKGSAEQSNHYTREVLETEIFPNKNPTSGTVMNMPILDIAFYPKERGQYNYDVTPTPFSSGIDINGLLNNPKTRWGGIMRKIETNDFEAANIEYIQFWMMDPFHSDNGIDEPNGVYHHSGGELYFNLGNISEDILKDNRKSFENGLPPSAAITNVDTTAWGRVPTQPALVNAFDNGDNTREFQDVGLDGLSDTDEKSFFDSTYIQKIAALHSTSSPAYGQAVADPSADNFHYFRGSDFDNEQKAILGRYKQYNGLDGNSSTTDNSPESYPTAATTIPSVEDINRDNTLSASESYYQYRVSLKPEDMVVGQNYITDKVVGKGITADKEPIDVVWYQFKIPVRSPEKVVGGIQDFTSIRFMRMFLTGFSDSIVCRFGRLELVRGDWRKYLFDMEAPGEYLAEDINSNTLFDVGAVSFEENGEKIPVNYVLPPDINRETEIGSATLRQLNEQSMVLKVCNLEDGDARAAYKNTGFDMRSYKKLQMYIHAEALNENEILNDGDLSVFVRLGKDYTENYYEYEIPLKITPPGKYSNDSEPDKLIVWPEANDLQLAFDSLTDLKMRRNLDLAAGKAALNVAYSARDGKNTLTVIGNPNLKDVTTIMVGIRNPKKKGTSENDDGFAKCAEVWVNELRLTDFDKNSGWATNGRVTTKLADFGTVTVAGNMSTPGFGSIEKKISERQKETIQQYDISSSFELGKVLPEILNLRVPVFLGVSEGVKNPQFNPNDPDIEFKELLNAYPGKAYAAVRDSIKTVTQDYTKRRSLNFTNVKKEKGKGATKSHIYDIENIALTYSYNESFRRDINTDTNLTKTYRGVVAYNYSTNPKNIRPFAQSKSLSKRKSTKLISDFNFFTHPSKLSFITSLDRYFNMMKIRNNSGGDFEIPSTFNKNFTMNRMYELRHDFTKSLKFDFNANNNSRILEPEGRIDTDEKRDSVKQSISEFGLNTIYNHSANLNYSWPINKFPLTDWITLTTRYGATYDWTRAPFAADTLGSTIKNSNSKQWNGQFNMVSLYNKVPYFKRVNQKNAGKGNTKNKDSKTPSQVTAPGAVESKKVTFTKDYLKWKKDKPIIITHNLGVPSVNIKITDLEGNDVVGKIDTLSNNRIRFTPTTEVENPTVTIEGMKPKKEFNLSRIPELALGVVLGLKNVSATYTENQGTILPGYNDSTYAMGMNRDFTAPGTGFIFGEQDPDFAVKSAGNGLLVKQASLNNAYALTSSKNFNARANLEPIKDLRVELNVTRNIAQNNSEFFRWNPNKNNPDGSIGGYDHDSPIETGNFSISYATWRTAFTKDNKEDNSSQVFKDFLENREVISGELAQKNNSTSLPDSTGYWKGYGATSQDVLIPAFLAAYSGTDASLISLDAFPKMPKPNWRITYDGLSKLEFMKKYFKSITLGHAYRSSYNVSSYTTNLLYVDSDNNGFIDKDINGNFIVEKQIAQISISEQFSPLINVDMTWNNSLLTKVELKRDRNLAFNFSDNRLQEVRGNEVIVGAGYRFKEVRFPFKIGPDRKTIRSDLNLRADVSVRANKTISRTVVDQTNQATNGQNVVSIKTAADYVINQRLNLRLFFDKIITNPLISTSFPSSNTNAGFSIRFTLS